MNDWKTRNNPPWSAAPLVALLIGLILGVLIAWQFWPVHWIQCDPIDLRQEAREEYLLMVANDYAVTRDASVALERLASWDPLSEAGREIRELADYRRAQGQLDVAQRLDALANGLPLPAAETQPATDGIQSFIYAIVGLVVIACILLARWLLALRRSLPEDRLREETRVAAEPSSGLELEEEEEFAPPRGRERPSLWPKRQTKAETTRPLPWDFEAVYAGEGAEFDRTFIIEDKDTNEYFGECGVGAAAFAGEDTELVNALEVWLFDKSDIRSEAKVLMSQYAYNNEDTREELASKGELVLARPGATFSLLGHRLQADGRIEDVQYLAGGPPESRFARLSIRLRVSRRESSASE